MTRPSILFVRAEKLSRIVVYDKRRMSGVRAGSSTPPDKTLQNLTRPSQPRFPEVDTPRRLERQLPGGGTDRECCRHDVNTILADAQGQNFLAEHLTNIVSVEGLTGIRFLPDIEAENPEKARAS